MNQSIIKKCIASEEVKRFSDRLLNSLENLEHNSLSFLLELMGMHIVIDRVFRNHNEGYGADDILEVFIQLFDGKKSDAEVMERLYQLTTHIHSFFRLTETRKFIKDKVLGLLRSRGGSDDDAEGKREYVYHLLTNLNPSIAYMGTALGVSETDGPWDDEREARDHKLLITLTKSVHAVIGNSCKQDFLETYTDKSIIEFVDEVYLIGDVLVNEIAVVPENPEGKLLLQHLILQYSTQLKPGTWVTLNPAPQLIKAGISPLTKNKGIMTSDHQIDLIDNQLIFLRNNDQFMEEINNPEEQNKVLSHLIRSLPEILLITVCIKFIMFKILKYNKAGQITLDFCQNAELKAAKEADPPWIIQKSFFGDIYLRSLERTIHVDKKGLLSVRNQGKAISGQAKLEVLREFCNLFSYHSQALHNAEAFFDNHLSNVKSQIFN